MKDIKRKRWISLFVENEIGVLARVSGLLAGKSYNLDSLTVGMTEDPTISRMTIGLTSDDKTFEQIKKQLNRTVEVIRVLDFTDIETHRKELMYIRVYDCGDEDLAKLSILRDRFSLKIEDYQGSTVLVESVMPEEENDRLIGILQEKIQGRIEIVRGGNVAIESI